MARNVAIQVIRGITANIPSLNNGEFYLATDTGQLYVGLNGVNFRVGNPIMAAVEINGNANPSNYIEPNIDGSVSVKAPGGAALALDGTDATGVSGYTGSSGIRGWLSSLYAFFNNCANTKGTLANLVLSVQEPKDVGRTSVVLSLTKATAITTEALVTLTQKKGAAATSSGATYTVTAGKTLRIQSIFVSITNITAAAIDNVAVRLREGAAGGGAATLTSDIIAEVEAATMIATLGTGDQTAVIFPDGFEIAGGQQIAVSMVSLNVDGAVTIVVNGFEY